MSNKVDRFNQQLGENILAYFSSYAEAEQTVIALSQAGFDPQKLSIVSKEYQLSKRASGAVVLKHSATTEATGNNYWGSLIGGVVGILAGVVELSQAGMSLLVFIYPIAGVLLGWLFAAMSVGVAGVFGVSSFNAKVPNFEARVPADDFIIWVSGSREDVLQSKQMLAKI
jgi:hypothetical protein